MRTIFLILILVVLALIAAVATGWLDIRQTQSAELPDVSVTDEGVDATGGQAPAFDVKTGTVEVGTRKEEVSVPVPTVDVEPPAGSDDAPPAKAEPAG